MNTIDDPSSNVNTAFGDPATRQAAVRIPADAEAERPLPAESKQKSFAFDPTGIGTIIGRRDPVYYAIHSKWRDQQQHGRVTYDVMLRHPEVSSALGSRLRIVASTPPRFRPVAKDPSPKQKEIADFANHILSLIDWPSFMDGPIGQAYQYGFTLTEITTRKGVWRGKKMVLLDELIQLPQASLDHGYLPREEFGQLAMTNNVRYRCFSFDEGLRGRITAYHQYHTSIGTTASPKATWSGREMNSILHIKIGGGDGNPWGHSALHSAYYPWSELYSLEQISGVHRDTSLSWLLLSYKTPNNEGIPRPKLHSELTDIIQKQHPSASNRFIIAPDLTGTSVSPINPAWTAERESAETRLTRQIWKAIFIPQSIVSEVDEGESDTRNLQRAQAEFFTRNDQQWIGRALLDLVMRIVESNYGFLDSEDRPCPKWPNITEDKLRVLQTVFQQIYPDLAAERVGEVVERFTGGVIEAEHFPASPNDRVEEKWPRRDANDEPNSPFGNSPPPKQPGEKRVRTDRQTDNPSSGR